MQCFQASKRSTEFLISALQYLATYVLVRQNFGPVEMHSFYNKFLSCHSYSSRWQSLISSKNKLILTFHRWLTWSPSCRAPHWPDIGTRRSQTLSPAHSAMQLFSRIYQAKPRIQAKTMQKSRRAKSVLKMVSAAIYYLYNMNNSVLRLSVSRES